MLPIYGSQAISFDTTESQNVDEVYNKYIDKYLDAINQFDYDFYPLWYNASQGKN